MRLDLCAQVCMMQVLLSARQRWELKLLACYWCRTFRLLHIAGLLSWTTANRAVCTCQPL